MKRLILIFILSLFSYSNSLSYDEIAQMVLKIKQKREGIGLEELNGTPNPFTIVKKVVKKPKKKIVKKKPEIIKIIEPTFTLTAILNSKAFINGKWYGVNDKLKEGDYKVVYIGSSGVVIKSPRVTKRLKIESSAKKINLFGGAKR